MKIRQSFVSNSSSSSYIIAFKVPIVCKHCGRTDISIIDAIRERDHNSDNEVVGLGLESVKTIMISDFFGPGCDKEYKLVMKKIETLKGNEWDLALVKMSYHDEVLKLIFENAVNSGSIKIIYNDCD